MAKLVWGKFTYPKSTPENFLLLEQEMAIRRMQAEDFTRRVRANQGQFALNDAPEVQTIGKASFSFLDTSIYAIRADIHVEDTKLPSITTANWLRKQPYRKPLLENLPAKEVTIKLVHHITERVVGRKAQVWIAAVNGQSIIAKIYQACFLAPYLDKTRIRDFFPEEMEAHAEAWAYDRLRSVQGIIVPHSYGFFKVCKISETRTGHTRDLQKLLQINFCGNEAYVHLLEVIKHLMTLNGFPDDRILNRCTPKVLVRSLQRSEIHMDLISKADG